MSYTTSIDSAKTHRLLRRLLIFQVFAVLALGSSTSAQDERQQLKAMLEEDRSAAEAIALYPEDIRNHVLETCKYPEVVIRMRNLQSQAKASFLSTIEKLPRKDQEAIYELLRYEGLLEQLTLGDGPPSRADLDKILTNYPETVQQAAKKEVYKNFATLQEVANLKKETQQTFSSRIADYPTEAKAAFQALLKMPEVLEILSSNLEATVLTGDLYRKEPEWIKEKLNTLNLEVARKQAEELADYKAQLENDPEAFKEMQEAAELYSNENNVTSENSSASSSQVIYHAYPYWFGYPYWYGYSYWRPYPYHYHTGFYVSSSGTVIIIGLPSYHYVYWHSAHYPHRHVHLYAHYHRHYVRHPYGRGGFYASVDVNIHRNTRININRSREVNVRTDGPLRDNRNSPDRNRDRRQTLEVREYHSKNLNRFHANDNHRGNWQNRSSNPGNRKQGGRQNRNS